MQLSDKFMEIAKKKVKYISIYKIGTFGIALYLTFGFTDLLHDIGPKTDGPINISNYYFLYMAELALVVTFFVLRKSYMSKKKILSVLCVARTPEFFATNKRTKSVDRAELQRLSQLSPNEIQLLSIVQLYAELSISEGQIIYGVVLFGALIAYVTGSSVDMIPFTIIGLLMLLVTLKNMECMLHCAIQLVDSGKIE